MSTASKKESGQKPNRLIYEKSPYLLQHAYNPVDWYPWGKDAFEKARRENKPVFLSIGYSTCHWCHVMEDESFEDPEVARLMNETFVSIKVDREERPDIDNIYMAVCQMTTGSGGWPLTILMTPDKKPFFATTYVPKNDRFGRPGMLQLVPRIKEIWEKRRDEIVQSADQIAMALKQLTSESSGEQLDASVLRTAYEQLHQRYDENYGGFGNAPKFPTPHQLLYLLRFWKRSGNANALGMVEGTLQAMRRGGIYDHIGFGFHRYSTDRYWLLPHFEKMLYDQALLAMAYTETYQATGNEDYKKTAEEIFRYVLRDMTSPAGAFYSAEDADSEGVEGKFYLWTPEEIEKVVDKQDAEFVIRVFQVKDGGNFVDQATGNRTGESVLYLDKPLQEMAQEMKISDTELQTRIAEVREKLFQYREGRVHPYKDDKILTDWNGLMIAALAKGTQVFGEPKYAVAAAKSVDFLLKHLRQASGELLHRYREDEAAISGHVDDYAFLIWGLIELYEATFDVDYLQAALDANRYLVEHFWDEKIGGFFFTSDRGEELLVRSKEIYDGAVPSGNSVAFYNLLRLGRMTANSDLEQKASVVSQAFAGGVRQAPTAHTQMLIGVDFSLGPSYEVVIAGDTNAEDTRRMLRELRLPFVPNKVVLFRPTDQESPAIVRLAEFTKYQSSIDGKATAYVCLNYVCKAPTTDAGKMVKLLDK